MQHTLYTVLQDTFFFPPHHQVFFSSLCIVKSPESLPGRSILAPFSGNWRSSELDSIRFGLLIFRTFITQAGSSCNWRAHSLADTAPVFFIILQFSSELSNNWGAGLPCLHPLWIYCTGQQHKASLFPCLCSCLSSLCLQLLSHGSYLSFAQVLSFHTCTITSPFLRNADFSFFKHLHSPRKITRNVPASLLSALDSHVCF